MRDLDLPNLTTKEELPLANALGQSTFASMLFVGALIGGIVSQVFGRNVAFVLNSLSFFAPDDRYHSSAFPLDSRRHDTHSLRFDRDARPCNDVVYVNDGLRAVVAIRPCR